MTLFSKSQEECLHLRNRPPQVLPLLSLLSNESLGASISRFFFAVFLLRIFCRYGFLVYQCVFCLCKFLHCFIVIIKGMGRNFRFLVSFVLFCLFSRYYFKIFRCFAYVVIVLYLVLFQSMPPNSCILGAKLKDMS